jgi:hypothetical protein
VSLRVVGSPPDKFAIPMFPERRSQDLLDLLNRHGRLAVATLPVAAHFAAGTDERDVEDQSGRGIGSRLATTEVKMSSACPQQVLCRVGLCHELVDCTPVSHPS